MSFNSSASKWSMRLAYGHNRWVSLPMRRGCCGALFVFIGAEICRISNFIQVYPWQKSSLAAHTRAHTHLNVVRKQQHPLHHILAMFLFWNINADDQEESDSEAAQMNRRFIRTEWEKTEITHRARRDIIERQTCCERALCDRVRKRVCRLWNAALFIGTRI